MDDIEAISLVMSHLSLVDAVRASQVCKLWREASLKPLTLPGKSSLDLSPFLPLRDPNVALRLLTVRGANAVAVNLGFIRLSFSFSSFVPHLSTLLRTLDLSSITSKKWITDESMDALTTRCQNLSRLNLFGCWLLTDTTLKYIGSRCLQVRRVWRWRKKTELKFFLARFLERGLVCGHFG